MTYRRRRDRWRKLPTKTKGRAPFGTHWGPFAAIPKVPGGAEMGVTKSGELRESRPFSFVKWLLLLPVGIAALVFFFPLFLGGPMWFVLAAVLLGVIWKTWRDYFGAS